MDEFYSFMRSPVIGVNTEPSRAVPVDGHSLLRANGPPGAPFVLRVTWRLTKKLRRSTP